MSDDFDENFYREVILDHYKNPRNYGTIDEPHAHAEGQNPLCGDEVTIDLMFDGDDKIIGREVLRPRLCDLAGGDVDADRASEGEDGGAGRSARQADAARRGRHSADADPAQVRVARPRCRSRLPCTAPRARRCRTTGRASTLPELEAGPLDQLPPGEMKLVEAAPHSVGVYNLDGELYAIEDRCSHDDGPLCMGNWDPESRRRLLPAARCEFRHQDRQSAGSARLPAGAHLPRPGRGRGGQDRDIGYVTPS